MDTTTRIAVVGAGPDDLMFARVIAGGESEGKS